MKKKNSGGRRSFNLKESLIELKVIYIRNSYLFFPPFPETRLDETSYFFSHSLIECRLFLILIFTTQILPSTTNLT